MAQGAFGRMLLSWSTGGIIVPVRFTPLPMATAPGLRCKSGHGVAEGPTNSIDALEATLAFAVVQLLAPNVLHRLLLMLTFDVPLTLLIPLAPLSSRRLF